MFDLSISDLFWKLEASDFPYSFSKIKVSNCVGTINSIN